MDSFSEKSDKDLEIKGPIERVAIKHALVAVVLLDSGPVQLMSLADVIARLRGGLPEQVTARIQEQNGIVVRDASKSEVEVIIKELDRQDLSYLIVPTKDLPEFKKIVELSQVRADANGLKITLSVGESKIIDWQKILCASCVMVEHPAGDENTGSRMLLSFVALDPMESFQLTVNVPPVENAQMEFHLKKDAELRETATFFHEKLSQSKQNKGVRILACHGLHTSWKGITFSSVRQAQGYFYWLAVLKKHQRDLRGAVPPKFSLPKLGKLETEVSSKKAKIPVFVNKSASHERLAANVSGESVDDLLLNAPAEIDWIGAKRVWWLNLLAIFAAICLAIYLILEIFQ